MLGAVITSRQADGRRSTATLAADVRFTVTVLGAFTVARGDVPFAVEPDQAPRKLDRWDERAREADEIIIAPRLMGG